MARADAIATQLDDIQIDTMSVFAKYDRLVDETCPMPQGPALDSVALHREFLLLQQMHHQLSDRALRQQMCLQEARIGVENMHQAWRLLTADIERSHGSMRWLS